MSGTGVRNTKSCIVRGTAVPPAHLAINFPYVVNTWNLTSPEPYPRYSVRQLQGRTRWRLLNELLRTSYSEKLSDGVIVSGCAGYCASCDCDSYSVHCREDLEMSPNPFIVPDHPDEELSVMETVFDARDIDHFRKKGWLSKDIGNGEIGFSGELFFKLGSSPIVYLVLKGRRVRYVGMSKHGIRRPLSRDHKQRFIISQADDVRVCFCVSEQAAKELEAFCILAFNPQWNQAWPNESTIREVEGAEWRFQQRRRA